MGHCIFLRKGETHTEPVTGTPLSNLAEGSIIKINESGSPVEFYVAKHDYEPDLNGNGRTLVVRKDCYSKRQWDSSGSDDYPSSSISNWLISTYENLFDEKVRNIIGTSKFGYADTHNIVQTIERSIFLLSMIELGKSGITVEGSALSIADTLQIAYLDGEAVDQWTRSHGTKSGTAYFVYADGQNDATGYTTGTRAFRIAFTLPASIKIDASGNVVV